MYEYIKYFTVVIVLCCMQPYAYAELRHAVEKSNTPAKNVALGNNPNFTIQNLAPYFPKTKPVIKSYLTPYTAKYFDETISFANRTINIPLEINRYTLTKPISIQLSTINEPVYMRLTRFEQPVALNNLLLKGEIDARWSLFRAPIALRHMVAKQPANFSYAYFAKTAEFFQTHCHKVCQFTSAIFLSDVSFDNSIFYDHVYFDNAQFNGTTYFTGINFDKELTLAKSVFKGNVDFSSTVFYDRLNLAGVKFYGKVDFTNTLFGSSVDMSDLHIEQNIIDLTKTEPEHPNKPIKINLVGTDLKKVRMRYHNFKLEFPPDTEQETIENIYRGLLTSFKQNGFERSYRKLFVEYEQYKHMLTDSYITSYIEDKWWNYGLEKDRIFYWIFILILFYSIINTFFYSRLIEFYFTIPFLESKSEQEINEMNPVLRYVYNFPRAIVMTMYIFFGGFLRFGITVENFKSKNLFVNCYFLLMMSTGFVCIFFIFQYLLRGS